MQGSTLEKKPWGQLAPKFLDLVASTIFLVAKNFRPKGPKTFYLKISVVQTINYAASPIALISIPDLDHFA